MSYLLAILFLIVALLYASVGFGGGSTYNALLILSSADYRLVPILALSCNIVVVTGNVIRYRNARHMHLRPLLPALSLSIPMAWLGGSLSIPETVFNILLGLALLTTALIMLKGTPKVLGPFSDNHTMSWGLIPVGAACGGLAGLVGIGGGIFLAPILYVIRWGSEKSIAAACSLFILLNSLSGLGGQITKIHETDLLPALLSYWALIPAVLLGGWIGNYLGVYKLPASWIRYGTAILVFMVAARLLWATIGELRA